MENFCEQRTVIEALLKAIDQASFVLKENPEQLFPQLYNRLQGLAEQERLLKIRLELEENNYEKLQRNNSLRLYQIIFDIVYHIDLYFLAMVG